EDKDDGEVEEVTVQILDEQRELRFAPVGLARLAYGARRWIGPEGFVICAAIVIAGESESARSPQNEHRRGEGNESRPPAWSAGHEQRRIHRRQIARARKRIVRVLERGPGRVDDESRETEEN